MITLNPKQIEREAKANGYTDVFQYAKSKIEPYTKAKEGQGWAPQRDGGVGSSVDKRIPITVTNVGNKSEVAYDSPQSKNIITDAVDKNTGKKVPIVSPTAKYDNGVLVGGTGINIEAQTRNTQREQQYQKTVADIHSKLKDRELAAQKNRLEGNETAYDLAMSDVETLQRQFNSATDIYEKSKEPVTVELDPEEVGKAFVATTGNLPTDILKGTHSKNVNVQRQSKQEALTPKVEDLRKKYNY